MFSFLLTLTFALVPSFAAPTRVDAAQALKKVQSHQAVVIDVREDQELADGTVQGALHFPISKVGTPEWRKFLRTLPKNKEVFTYCAAGPRADRVATALRREGFKANSTGGYHDWIRAGAKAAQK